MTLRAAEKMVREFEDRKEELERQGKIKKGEADGNEGGGGESEEEVDGKNQSKWCRKKHL